MLALFFILLLNAFNYTSSNPSSKLIFILYRAQSNMSGARGVSNNTGLYGEMVGQGRGRGGPGEEGGIGAVLWYQGESDTAEREEAEEYQGRMERLVRDLRVDLGEPQLLVIQVQWMVVV
ncbi:uncharacterized protein LOC109826550 [Asparagus officinalis]|uniref:uncharacterized protein LOC109826550 n=1 Tax=Asparagus officinalis TaxID=4686 RepID=UPI00098E8430|nr:uncharacterized protein LOC109826550 [Asparagus officinalis]